MHNQFVEKINANVPGANATLLEREAGDPVVFVDSAKLKESCQFLKDNEDCDFHVLQVITGADYLKAEATEDSPAEEERIEVSYILTSYNKKHDLILKTKLDRNNPEVESVVSIWASADFQERECFDMIGVNFLNHPDLRRILCPEDWEGFPLRKDYVVQESWHDMEVNPEHKMNIPEREFDKRQKEMLKAQKEAAGNSAPAE